MIPWLGFQNIWRRCYGSTGADAGSPRATGSTGSRFDSCPLNKRLHASVSRPMRVSKNEMHKRGVLKDTNP